jgi:hypothetical protein
MADYLIVVARTLSTHRQALVIRDRFIVRSAESSECLSCAVTRFLERAFTYSGAVYAHNPPQDLGNGRLTPHADTNGRARRLPLHTSHVGSPRLDRRRR